MKPFSVTSILNVRQQRRSTDIALPMCTADRAISDRLLVRTHRQPVNPAWLRMLFKVSGWTSSPINSWRICTRHPQNQDHQSSAPRLLRRWL